MGVAVRRWRLSPAKLFSRDRERAETLIRGRVVMERWKVWGLAAIGGTCIWTRAGGWRKEAELAAESGAPALWPP